MPELFRGHHEIKRRAREVEGVYQLVPQIASNLMDLPAFKPVEVITFGGSYAKETYKPGDDIDTDFIFFIMPSIDEILHINGIAHERFAENGLELQIRAFMDCMGTAIAIKRSTGEILEVQNPTRAKKLEEVYRPNTPYISRHEDMIKLWDLDKK